MTIEEAKKQLNHYRNVIRKIHHIQKKGEPGNQHQLIKFQHKRSSLLEHLDESEVLVRKADPDYYRQWVCDIIEKPDSREMYQFLTDLKELESHLRKAIEARAAGKLYTFQQETPHFMQQNFPYVDNDEWREEYIITLQPNVILTPGTLLNVFQAIGESTDSLEMDLFTGKSTASGTVFLHRRHHISFLQKDGTH